MYETAGSVNAFCFGAGMGLENIRRCADSMDLASTVGKGTELTINISLAGGGDAT